MHAREDLPPKVKEAAIAFVELLFDDLTPAVRDKPLPEFVDYVLDQTGYRAWVQKDPDAKRRLANLRLLRAMTTRYENAVTATNADIGEAREEGLGTFLADIATMSVIEGGDPDVGLPTEAKGVTMATIHAVKGLEFPVVFLAGLEEGIFPHAKAMKTAEGMEEETRLAYVAMTRAMSLLYLTYARSRVVGDEVKEHAPSRFLSAIPNQLIERRAATRESIPPMEMEATPLTIPIQEVQHAETG